MNVLGCDALREHQAGMDHFSEALSVWNGLEWPWTPPVCPPVTSDRSGSSDFTIRYSKRSLRTQRIRRSLYFVHN